MTATTPPVPTTLGRLRQLVASRTMRDVNFVEVVTTYYDLVNDIYRAGWGESHHFAAIRGDESEAQAQQACQYRLADRAGLAAGKVALDVGSGVGGPALTIAKHSGARVVGLDLSPRRVGCARERAHELGLSDQVSFVEGNALEMPFPNDEFDVVYSFEAICHIPDKRQAHAEMARVLKPGGICLGYDWLAKDGLTQQELDRYIEPVCQHHGVSHLSTPSELAEHLRLAGFQSVKVSNAADEGSFEPVWAFLDQAVELVIDSEDPLLRFMGTAGRTLSEAWRAGAFLIGYWEAS